MKGISRIHEATGGRVLGIYLPGSFPAGSPLIGCIPNEVHNCWADLSFQKMFVYIFIDCARSSLLAQGLSLVAEWGLLSSFGVWASYCGGFSYCET